MPTTGMSPGASRCSGLPFRPCVKTGSCSRNQSSSGVDSSRRSVNARIAHHVGLVAHPAELADDGAHAASTISASRCFAAESEFETGQPFSDFSSSCLARAASVPGGTTRRTRVMISVKRLCPSTRSSLPSTSADELAPFEARGLRDRAEGQHRAVAEGGEQQRFRRPVAAGPAPFRRRQRAQLRKSLGIEADLALGLHADADAVAVRERVHQAARDAAVVAGERALGAVARADHRARHALEESARERGLAQLEEFRRASRSARPAGDSPSAAGTGRASGCRRPVARRSSIVASISSSVSPRPSIRLVLVRTAGRCRFACASTSSVCSVACARIAHRVRQPPTVSTFCANTSRPESTTVSTSASTPWKSGVSASTAVAGLRRLIARTQAA